MSTWLAIKETLGDEGQKKPEMTDCQRIKTSKTIVINKGQSQRERRVVVGVMEGVDHIKAEETHQWNGPA